MERRLVAPRPHWRARAQGIGFDFHTPGGQAYWDESACYAFSLAQIEDHIERATEELGALTRELAGRFLREERLYDQLAIPAHARDLIAASFRRRDPSLYGRFDFAYDGAGPPKLLEYNADTPTALLEVSVFQWGWLEDLRADGRLPPHADQFNSLHERLIERWAEVATSGRVHLACMANSSEDAATIAYLADCARQAGRDVRMLEMGDIGLDGERFCDPQGERIETLFKLYPWEWIFKDEFGQSPALRRLRCIEPPWKCLLSNKGMLALLWEMAPGHPNLLPTYFETDPARFSLGARFAKKPIWSREGANVLLVDGETVLASTGGDYGKEGHVRQQLVQLPDFDGNYPVIGSWLVGERACGMGIREDRSRITGHGAHFMPHVIL